MTEEAPMRGNRRGVRRWIWALPVALPAAALLLANLWLAFPPGRAWVAAKVQRRVGLEVRVGSSSCWPWSGIILRGVEILQPPPLRPAVKEPFARISAIRITPIWRSWLRGSHEFRALEIDAPRLVLPVELLADLAKTQVPPPPAATTPPLAATPPMVGPPAPVPAPPAAPAVPATVLPPTVWLRMENASFTLFSASSDQAWFGVSGLHGSIPVAGRPAESTVHVRSIQVPGGETLTKLQLTLDWKHPLLSLRPHATQLHGLHLTLAGQLGLSRGLPLQIEALLPRQTLAPIPLPNGGQAAAKSIPANARFRGLLLAPATWQGDFLAEAKSPSATFVGSDVAFDRGSAIAVLRGGILSCIDARLIGDELSFLGNATVLADGRAAAALRMVAPPENATTIAARAFPGNPQVPSLTPLATPQRAAFDLEAFGNIRQLFLRLGKDGPIVQLTHSNTSP